MERTRAELDRFLCISPGRISNGQGLHLGGVHLQQGLQPGPQGLGQQLRFWFGQRHGDSGEERAQLGAVVERQHPLGGGLLGVGLVDGLVGLLL